MKYPEEFKTAVREDILRRMNSDKDFAETVMSLPEERADEIRERSYAAYAKKPEFAKIIEDNKPYISKIADDLGNIPGPYLFAGLPVVATLFSLSVGSVAYWVYNRRRSMPRPEKLHRRNRPQLREWIRAHKAFLFFLALGASIVALLYIFRWEYSYTGRFGLLQVRRNIYTGETQYRGLNESPEWKPWTGKERCDD